MHKKQVADQMIEKCLEEDQKAYEEAKVKFRARVANLDAEPGVSRIQELEKIWGELNHKRKATSSEVIHALLEDIDEAELVESKKENTKKEG